MPYGRASRFALGTVVVASATSVAQAQSPITLSGRITTDNGLPLSDVSVELRTQGLGALSRADGRYTITVPTARQLGGSTVQVSVRRLGYRGLTRTVTLPASGAVTADFTMTTNPLQLGEVVVTGAGTTTQAERTGIIRKSVDSSAISRSNEVNLVTALAGKAPGVVVQQQSGEAGGGARIQIRGQRSVTGTGQPLFIIDGQVVNNATNITGSNISSTTSPNRLNDLNPNDIASMEVLSGAAGAAIYGSLAGNGVVLITTKRGRAGRTTYSLQSTAAGDRPIRTLPYQQRFGVGTGGVSPACVEGGPANCFLSAGFFSFGAPLNPGVRTFNQVSEIFETGSRFDNTLQVQGGNDRTTFLFSGGALLQDGFYVTGNDSYNRYTGRLNASHRAADNLTVGGNFTYSRTDLNGFGRGNNTNGMLLPALRTPPNFDNRQGVNGEGLHRAWRYPNPSGPAATRANRGFDNPFYVVNAGETAPQATDRTLGGVNASWTPLTWLKVDYNLGVDVAAEDRLEARPEQASGAPVGGSISRWQFNQRILDHVLSARAEKRWSDAVTTRFTVGQQLNQNTFRQIFATGNTLVAAQPYRLDNTTQAVPPTDAETTTRLEAYYGQVQTDLFDQLFVTLLARNDGSSTFGTETNRAWYPNVQVAWTAPQSMRVPGVSGLKLRTSYGETGIVPNAYLLQSVYLGGTNVLVDFNPGSVVVPNVGGFGGLFAGGNRGNPRIEPARIGEFETGADLAFLNNRLDLGVTYYQQQTRRGVVSTPLSPSSGFATETRNAVRMRNIGMEFQANARVLQSRDWQVELGANYAFNRNRVQSLGDSSLQTVGVGTSFGGRTTNAVVGEQLGAIRGTDFARCRYTSTSNLVPVGGTNVDVNAACQAAGAPEGALYIAQNGFPVADPTERTVGDPNPNFTAGFRTNVTFKRLNFNTFWDVRRGGTIQNMTKASMYNYGTHGDTENRGRTAVFGQDYRLGGNGSASFPVVGPGAGRTVVIDEAWYSTLGGVGGPVAQWQENAGFVRLREISLGANLNQRFVQRLGLSSIDVRAAGQNIALWSDYTGFDPEVSLSGGAVISQGFDWFSAPTARSLVFTISLNR